jgi:hypothetical protein
VIFYAVVSDEIEQVIEFFATAVEAQAMLERVLNGGRIGERCFISSPSNS